MEFRDNLMICRCGRIHTVSHDVIEAALNRRKEILFICARCGNAAIIGGDESTDPDTGDITYIMHTNDFRGEVITPEVFISNEKYKGLYQILYKRGYGVPMQTGMYATDYFNGVFSDHWYPYFDKIMRYGVNGDDVINFVSTYNRQRTTVDMGRFIRETPEEVLEQLSRKSIPGLNWRGTAYESKFNSK